MSVFAKHTTFRVVEERDPFSRLSTHRPTRTFLHLILIIKLYGSVELLHEHILHIQTLKQHTQINTGNRVQSLHINIRILRKQNHKNNSSGLANMISNQIRKIENVHCFLYLLSIKFQCFCVMCVAVNYLNSIH